MERMNGFLGDRMLVNGQERPPLGLGTRAYRVRLLNGSNSRIYTLAWAIRPASCVDEVRIRVDLGSERQDALKGLQRPAIEID